jgi:hypothetical protein
MTKFDSRSLRALTAGATRVALRRLTVLLLTRVSTWTALWRTLLLLASILLALGWVSSRLLSVSLLRRRAVLALTLWRLSVLTWWRGTVLAALRWSAVLLLLSVALLRGATKLTTRGSAIAARCGVSLLILGVVGAIDGTEQKLDDP